MGNITFEIVLFSFFFFFSLGRGAVLGGSKVGMVRRPTHPYCVPVL